MGRLVFLLLFFSYTSFGYSPLGKDYCNFSTSVPVAKAIPNPVADKVYTIFSANCNGCHGKGASGGGGVITDILDRDYLVNGNFVNLTTPTDSRIWKAITRLVDPMPKGKPPLSLPDRTSILDWIKAGAPDWETTPPVITKQVSYLQIVACIYQTVSRIDYLKRGDAVNYEFALLDNIYNAGNTVAFKNLGDALDKALNQTAFGPTQIVNTGKVDSEGIIRKIDLRDYNRKRADFDVKLLVDAKYPYAIDYNKGNYYTREELDDIAFYEKEIERLTKSPRAFIRADFIVDTILGPQYYDFLFQRGQADNLAQLERTLGVDSDRAIADFEVNASIIRRSGVSLFNRLIHRYDSTYNLMGVKTSTSYWRTFDTASEADRKFFFAFPIGPDTVKFNFFTARFFDFDAGMQIFGMPNKLQGFFIADKKGNRLQEAVINIAVDPDNNHPFLGSAPGVVEVGISCNHCHGGGVNVFTDQGLYNTQKTAGLTAQELNAIRQLYPVQAVWNTAFNSYNTTFLTAHKQVTSNPLATSLNGEPTWLSDRAYQDVQTIDQVAAEFGVSTDEFKECMFHEPDLASEIGLSDPVLGKVTRAVLIQEFSRIADDCGYGKAIKFIKKKSEPPVRPPDPPVKPPVKPPEKPCDLIIRNKTDRRIDFTLIYPGEAGRKFMLLAGKGGKAPRRGDPELFYSIDDKPTFKSLFDCYVYEFQEFGSKVHGSLRKVIVVQLPP